MILFSCDHSCAKITNEETYYKLIMHILYIVYGRLEMQIS